MSAEHTQLQVQEVLDAFVREANVVGVQVSDRSGAPLALSGDLFRVDPRRFAASLAGLVGNATGLMRPFGQAGVRQMHLHAGDVELLVSLLNPGYTVAVIFDDRSSLGVVRWRMSRLSGHLIGLLGGSTKGPPMGQISDEEIENLFT